MRVVSTAAVGAGAGEPFGISDLDLYLFNEGTHRRLWELLGPRTLATGTRFAVWAPAATAVGVVGDWNDWRPEGLSPLATSGIWVAMTAAKPGDRYKLLVTGADGVERWRADPMARQSECPPANASIVPAADIHRWSDDRWLRERGAVRAGAAPLRIYEVHLGSWRCELRTWESLAEALAAHVERLGFTHIELLPVAEHPFGGSWGYQVTGYYSPTARFGTPDGLRGFVDLMHQRGIGVLVDWVPAHFPRDEWALGRFDGTALYEHLDPRLGEHPDWGTYVFNYGRLEVRNFLIANALYWFDEFHIDGLRVDAVASMLYLDYSRAEGQWVPNRFGGRENLEAIDFLRDLNRIVGEEFDDVLMIAEESTAWPGVTRAVEQGGLGFTHKWNLGWMHDTLGYFARDPVHRSHHHGDLTFTMLYAHHERFVLPLSHDEVVHGKGSLIGRLPGDDWQRLANLRALFAWQWLIPGAPLVFMGSELAPRQEWSAEDGLDWSAAERPAAAGIAALITDLNSVADRWPALWVRDDDPGGFQWLAADENAVSVYAFIRWDRHGRSALICVANLTPVPRPGFRLGAPWGGRWELVLDTDAEPYGGSGRLEGRTGIEADDDIAWQGQGSSLVLDLPPLAVVVLGALSPGVH